MRWTIPRKWKAVALAATGVTLMTPWVAGARNPNEPAPTKNLGDLPQTNRASSIPMLTMDVGLGIDVSGGQGIPGRVKPDQSRVHEIVGEVVELDGRTLYVAHRGAVVPLDLSALRIKKEPQPGQQVLATYQVENRTKNMALSLAGETTRPPEG